MLDKGDWIESFFSCFKNLGISLEDYKFFQVMGETEASQPIGKGIGKIEIDKSLGWKYKPFKYKRME